VNKERIEQPIPSPKFDTHRVSEILRRLKSRRICKESGEPYRRIYIKGDLNTLNSLASRELGVGRYTIKQYHNDWYYLGLLEEPATSGRGRRPGVKIEKKPVTMDSWKLLNTKWSEDHD
jgi:hypothetical protein